MTPLKPAAWIGPVGQLMSHEIYQAWAPRYPDEAKGFRPLYGGEALDGLRELVNKWRASPLVDAIGSADKRSGDAGCAIEECADELEVALRAFQRKDSLHSGPT